MNPELTVQRPLNVSPCGTLALTYLSEMVLCSKIDRLSGSPLISAIVDVNTNESVLRRIFFWVFCACLIAREWLRRDVVFCWGVLHATGNYQKLSSLTH